MSDVEETSTETTSDAGGVLSSEGTEPTNENTASDSGVLSSGENNSPETNEAEQSKDNSSEGTEGAKKEAEVAGAPEQYEAFNIPEGMKFDEAALTEYQTLAKELNLSQENAQKLVDYQAKLAQSQRDALDAACAKEAEEWKAETMKAFSKEEIADGVRGFRSAPKEVQQMLSACGFDSHKSFVEFFINVGRSIKEDKFETGKPSAGKDGKSAANVLYPDLT